jgi:hypothetical protein
MVAWKNDFKKSRFQEAIHNKNISTFLDNAAPRFGGIAEAGRPHA